MATVTAPHRRRAFRITIGFAVLAGLASQPAAAGSGTKPASIAVDYQSTVQSSHDVHLIMAGGKPVPVFEDSNGGVNPEGITFIRGGNHKIARKTSGTPLLLMKATGTSDGSIAVVYTSGALQRYVRLIRPDNTLGFERLAPGDRWAGVTPDGADGAYLAEHVAYAEPGTYIADETKFRGARPGLRGGPTRRAAPCRARSRRRP